MIENLNIAFVASECQPFFTSGGLGDVIGSLPKKIVKASKKEECVTVYLPLYSTFSTKYANKLTFIGAINVGLSWRNQYCGIYKYIESGVKYYFLDNEYYFKRGRLYGYFDDAERFAFFSKAVIDVMLYLKEVPNVIHCHDWQTGLVSVYLRTLYYHYDEFKNVKRVFTIHNIEYQGVYNYDDDIIEDVFGISCNDAYLLEFHGSLNIMKGAMECSNIVSTVSPNYANEIKDARFAHGLEEEVNRIDREGKLCGILNGIDRNFYNPKTDKSLFKTYNKTDFSNKTENKFELQKMLGLPVSSTTPLIGMVTRLVGHKGLELVKNGIDELMTKNVQLVILGTGDVYFEDFFKESESKYPNKLKTILAFNQDLARKIYAASDLFLMPSLFEPCGLSQMISSRYGSVPIVRETGGLKDSIKDFSTSDGNGYTFNGYNSLEMLAAISNALSDFNDQVWSERVKSVMTHDFSWTVSAKQYLELYNKLFK